MRISYRIEHYMIKVDKDPNEIKAMVITTWSIPDPLLGMSFSIP